MTSTVATDLVANDKVTAAVNKAAAGLKQYANQARGALAGVSERFNALGQSVSGFSRKLAGSIPGLNAYTVGVAALGAALYKSVQFGQNQIGAEKKLAAVFKATGNAAGLSVAEIKKFASARQEITNFGDEATIAVSAVLATFKEVKGDVFKDALVSIQDMSTVLGTDMQGNAIQLGKALNDPIKGITALSRAGVSFTEQQKAQIKVLQESGNILGAQKIILSELKSEFGGAAEAMANPFVQMKNAIGDLMESIGAALLPAINTLSKAIGGLAKFLNTLTGGWLKSAATIAAFVAAAGGVLVVVAKAVAIFKTLIVTLRAYASAQAIAQAFSGPAGWATLAAGAVIATAAVASLAGAFDEVEASAKGAAVAASKVSGVAGISAGQPSVTESLVRNLAQQAAVRAEMTQSQGGYERKVLQLLQDEQTMLENLARTEASRDSRRLAVEEKLAALRQSWKPAMERARESVGQFSDKEIAQRRSLAERAAGALGGRTKEQAPEEFARAERLMKVYQEAVEARKQLAVLGREHPAALARMQQEAIGKETGIDVTSWIDRYREKMQPILDLYNKGMLSAARFREEQRKVGDSFGLTYGPMETFRRAMQATIDKFNEGKMTVEAYRDAVRKLSESQFGPMLTQGLQGKLNEKFADIERDFQQRFGRNLTPGQAAAEREARRKQAVGEVAGLEKTPQEQFAESMQRAATARGQGLGGQADKIERDANRKRMADIREQAREQAGLNAPFADLLTNTERLKSELEAIKGTYQAGGFGAAGSTAAMEIQRRSTAAALEQYGKKPTEAFQPRFEGLQDTWRRIQESAAGGKADDPQERVAKVTEESKGILDKLLGITDDYFKWSKDKKDKPQPSRVS